MQKIYDEQNTKILIKNGLCMSYWVFPFHHRNTEMVQMKSMFWSLVQNMTHVGRLIWGVVGRG